MEATAVVPGVWRLTDRVLKLIIDFSHTQGAKIGIQFAHAGRKASVLALPLQWSAYRTRYVDNPIANANEN